MSAKSTPRARGGLCLAAGTCPGWVEGMVAVGQTGARHPWISLEYMQKMSTNLINGTIWKSVNFVINDFQEQNLTCYRHRDGTCNGKLNESNMTC